MADPQFNVELDETEEYRDEIRPWKTCDYKEHRPPPLVIEVFLDTSELTPKQTLVLLDDGKRFVSDGDVVLEQWTIELGAAPDELPPDLNVILPLVYKKSIVLFRSLYTYAAFLPAWKLKRKLKMGYRLERSSVLLDSEYSFGVTDSPAGPFGVRVKYRQNCDYRVDDSESILSSRFMNEDLFRPSIPGSLPSRGHVEPDLGQAYGSLSTFHQAGAGTSPMSALRQQEVDDESPKEKSRRPSFSFQPFKTPVLSASPSLAPKRPTEMPPPAPRPRYSSSFSHRRARPSDDSGKTSVVSQPNEDDENISDFIKMLESKRDLLAPTSATAEATTRRTNAALNRYQRMRESTLSESMMSHPSSTSSRNPPPMIAASASTSSLGKPISPHTPHTPAIPSRLSANSIVDYDSHLSEEAPSDSTVVDTQTVPPIDIPTSPRPLVPYRSSSAAQRRSHADYGQRSASMGATRTRKDETKKVTEKGDVQEKSDVQDSGSGSGSSNLYRPRLRARMRGTPSDSGSGSFERRARSSFSRPDEEEPFLPFAMSDIGASRRSLEERAERENRRGSRGGSRRG